LGNQQYWLKIVLSIVVLRHFLSRKRNPKAISCIIHEDSEKSSKPLPEGSSRELAQKQSVFWDTRIIRVLAVGE
jgi:hypothetical protein